jgi:protein-disulfide isomerase
MNRFWLMIVAVWAAAGSAASGATLAPIGPDDFVLGSDKAPVTVIEYASLTCPHCARWENEVFPKVKSDLIDSGKIRYAFRDFPLDGIALKAATLARCDQGRYYSFIEVLFETQMSWLPRSADQDPTPELLRIGKLGGLSEAKAQACLTDQKLSDAVVASRQQGETAGVNSTPTFFFNGKSHAGELPYDDFVKMVQDAGS